MKTQIFLTMSVLLVNLTSASSSKMSTHDMEIMINGYIDGLLHVNTENQETECSYPAVHAQVQWQEAMDGLWQCTDWWMTPTTRYRKFQHNLQRILDITPQIVQDMGECPMASEDLAQIKKWEDQYQNPQEFVNTVIGNFYKKMLQMTSHVFSAMQAYSAGNYWQFGNDLGLIVNLCLNKKEL